MDIAPITGCLHLSLADIFPIPRNTPSFLPSFPVPVHLAQRSRSLLHNLRTMRGRILRQGYQMNHTILSGHLGIPTWILLFGHISTQAASEHHHIPAESISTGYLADYPLVRFFVLAAQTCPKGLSSHQGWLECIRPSVIHCAVI